MTNSAQLYRYLLDLVLAIKQNLMQWRLMFRPHKLSIPGTILLEAHQISCRGSRQFRLMAIKAENPFPHNSIKNRRTLRVPLTKLAGAPV